MSDTKETGRKTLTLNKKVGTGHVRQSFSHGRSKSVLVEKKKKRIINRRTTVKAADTPGAGKPEGAPGVETVRKKPALNTAGKLSPDEMNARLRALEEARQREIREAAERKRREEQEARARAEAEREAARRAEEERKAAEERARIAAEEAAAKAAAETAAESNKSQQARDNERSEPAVDEQSAAPKTAAKKSAEKKAVRGKVQDVARPEMPSRRHLEPEGRGSAKRGRGESRPSPRRHEEERFKGRLTITNALDEGGGRRPPSIARLKRKLEKQKKQAAGVQKQQVKISREVVLPEAITIQELSNRMAERAVDVIKFLMKQGQMHEINDVIDADTAELIAEEFGHTVKRVSEADVEEGFFGEEDDESDLKPRPPVVTVMGHVDHGKTSLLDAIRQTNVASGEAGGITQHIGAYQVEDDEGRKITFIDTPGHAAFTAMRARGAKVTDLVILVVAADDGVMPQTIEAINHAKAADVPIIVAINKIDLPTADPNRVRNELLQHDVFVESLGGDVLDVEVSAKKRLNLDELLEAVHLQAEMLELRANPDRAAVGIVIEAQLERGRGPVGTVLVQRGTLKVGNVLVAGVHWGKVRALIDDKGQHVVEAGPSKPVEVLGFNSAPEAGDECAVVENEAKAREITEYRQRKRRETLAAGAGSISSLEQMMAQLKQDGAAEFPLVVKGDVQGSVEAITNALEQLGNDEVRARIVHAAVGGISESDVTLAAASNAVVIGFNVRANIQAKQLAAREGVEIRYYSVIYDLVDDIKAAMSGLLKPTYRERFIGNAEILEVFNISKVGKVAGCRVTEGKVERGAGVRLIRDNVVIHEGKLSTLKRFKDEVSEVAHGQECGMAFENYQDMRPGDIIEAFQIEEVERTL